MAKTNEELEAALDEANKRLDALTKQAEKDNDQWPEIQKKLEALEATVLEKIKAVETSSSLSLSEKSTLLADHQKTLDEIKGTLKAMEPPGNPAPLTPSGGQGDGQPGVETKPQKRYRLI